MQEIKSQIQEWLGEKDRKSFWLFGHAVTIQKIQNSEISWVVRFAQSHTSFEVNGKDDKVTHNWTRNWREAASVSDLKFLLQSLRIGLGKEPTPSGRVTSELEGWLRQIKTRRNHDIRSKVLIK
ncbi:MAG: hypothetical protein HY397_02860 [Candidatus Doudnabacteria bacterium]|nr:hypothetical protein [Candidatus Doudnabacteria bacterium]